MSYGSCNRAEARGALLPDIRYRVSTINLDFEIEVGFDETMDSVIDIVSGSQGVQCWLTTTLAADFTARGGLC